ncbi:hypothetical protein SLEP1_g44034 [Rubroshorea leprosula]|uniref:NB-ARC domain-containing protein n=1 Tax=Rubroshorea leprosula TaxID=152421 RepID=A0AAV5LFK7_9ROSI|nr:hypothetical protein SLEP1_g44034 [Rubroshorea leprosula]
MRDESSGNLECVCCLLQEALYGKSILILLDDGWEQDIVHWFAKLCDNDCKYLVTTRDESVYEITEAEKVELNTDDIKEISKAILLYHSLLSEEELPSKSMVECSVPSAESLLERCGHHPLTVAVMGKALRKEIRAEKWTFEFSLEAMPVDSRRLFIALSALSWSEPVPEACLEAIWSVLGQESLFSLVICKLVEGSLIMKNEMGPLYQVHDMLSLYLDSKTTESVQMLLNRSAPEETAFVCPWVLIFGKEKIKKLVEPKIVVFLGVLKERQAVITLESIFWALMLAYWDPGLQILFQLIQKILLQAEVITNIFSKTDYCYYFASLETSGAVDKLTVILESCENPCTKINILTVLAKLAEFGGRQITDKVLQSIPFKQLSNLLSPDAVEWHDNMFTILMSLTKGGKSKAVERMCDFDIDKNFIKLLEDGSEVLQRHAIVTLKAFYELAPNSSLKPSNLSLLPWQVRLPLETPHSQGGVVVNGDKKQVMKAMQDLIPIVAKAGDPSLRELIIESPLIKRLSELLQSGHSEQNSMRSESAFLLMKLACSGGEPFIKKFPGYNIISELVKMMYCQVTELQDSAYTALHHMIFCNGGGLVLNKIFTIARQQSLHRDQILSSLVVEKLAKSEKDCGGSGQTVLKYLEGIDKCKNLSMAERKVLKQQVIRKVRSSLKVHKFEARILAALDACLCKGSRGASSSTRHRK